ncbi:MAG: FGGY family carbohydrate kinase [Chloroflexota bacterium]
MKQSNTFIALDIGTSFIKGALLDLDTRTMSNIMRQPFPEPVPNLPANFFEVDPDALISAVRQLLMSLADQVPDCRGVVTCTQMHGLVLTDNNHHPLTNIITWRDQRTINPHPAGNSSYYDVLIAQLTERERAELGGGLRAGLPIGTLFWMAEENRLPPSPATPLTLSEFVLGALCTGDINPIIEPTNAAAYGAYDISRETWHSSVLEKLGLAGLQWPEIGSVSSVIGYADLNGQRVPCYTSVGDHQCALAGSFLETGELSLNVATGSQVSLITPTLSLGQYETRPYFDHRFLNTLVKLPAGRSLNLLVNLVTELSAREGAALANPWASITDAVTEVGQQGVENPLTIDLAFYDSADGADGSIGNIREDNLSVGHLFHAAFQRMAHNYVQYGLQVAGAQHTWHRIVFSGGLVQKVDALRQMILDTFQQAELEYSHRLSMEEEDTLLGLMVIALHISSEADSVAEATRFF